MCLATTPIKSKYVRVPYQKRKRNFSKNFYNNCEDNTSMYQDRRGRLSLSSGQVGRKIGTKENSIMALPERKNKKNKNKKNKERLGSCCRWQCGRVGMSNVELKERERERSFSFFLLYLVGHERNQSQPATHVYRLLAATLSLSLSFISFSVDGIL